MVSEEFQEPSDTDFEPIGRFAHFRRILLIATTAGLLLCQLATHTDIFFADGLRYITQARAIDRGAAVEALKNAVDHPLYPLAIAAVHRLGGGKDPLSWQIAAQLASAIAGVLLVFPLYLVSRELFGDRVALPACLLFFAVPLTGHVFADAMSESLFLLFWLTGLWAALRFLRSGRLQWVPLLVAGSVLAYMTRPEGLLLPAAVLTTLGLSPRWVLGGLGKRGLLIPGLLILGTTLLVAPYVAMKGGLGTKPSVARLLGTAPRSAPHAVERQKPLDLEQSPFETYGIAVTVVAKALKEAVPLPLLILAVPGIILVRRREGFSTQWTLLAVITSASFLALVRLHATGGYCSPRHAILPATLLIPAAASGLCRLVAITARSFPGGGTGWKVAAGWLVVISALVLPRAREVLSPLNQGLGGYREAGFWLKDHASEAGKVVDVTGWSQFYCMRPGYTFADLISARDDPEARWVVVREAHLTGPWEYCQRLRALVEGHTPVVVFQGGAGRSRTRVLVFDRSSILSAKGVGERPAVRR